MGGWCPVHALLQQGGFGGGSCLRPTPPTTTTARRPPALPCPPPPPAPPLQVEEGWVQCDKCEGWVHQICGLFNKGRNDENRGFLCPYCLRDGGWAG